jgi:hypothetical protein
MSTSAFRVMHPASFEPDAKLASNSIQTALNAGDLKAAKHVFAEFVRDVKENRLGPGLQHPLLGQDLQSVEQALAANDLTAAQKALTKLELDMQSLLRHGLNGSVASTTKSTGMGEVSFFDVMA